MRLYQVEKNVITQHFKITRFEATPLTVKENKFTLQHAGTGFAILADRIVLSEKIAPEYDADPLTRDYYRSSADAVEAFFEKRRRELEKITYRTGFLKDEIRRGLRELRDEAGRPLIDKIKLELFDSGVF